MFADKDKGNRNHSRNGGGLRSRKKKDDENQSFHVKHKKDDRLQLVCGIHPVMEALGAGKQIDKVLMQNNLDGRSTQELRAKIREKGVPLQIVPVEKLNRMTDSNHQGVVAIVSPITYCVFAELIQRLFDEGKSPVVVLLDHVTDVRNLGAIVRTAECAGVDAVVVPDHGSAQINEDAIKSSSGALLRMPVCRESNFKTTLNLARQMGMQVCAATEKGSVDYRTVDFTKPTVLVMGAEDTGVSPEVLRLSDVHARLPLMGEVMSLNVSVAAGVFMYEVLNQRNPAVLG